MNLRTWEEWTEEERKEFKSVDLDVNNSCETPANKALEIAQRPAPRQETNEKLETQEHDCETCTLQNSERQGQCKLKGLCIISFAHKDRPKLTDKDDYYITMDPPNEGDL